MRIIENIRKMTLFDELRDIEDFNKDEEIQKILKQGNIELALREWTTFNVEEDLNFDNFIVKLIHLFSAIIPDSLPYFQILIMNITNLIILNHLNKLRFIVTYGIGYTLINYLGFYLIDKICNGLSQKIASFHIEGQKETLKISLQRTFISVYLYLAIIFPFFYFLDKILIFIHFPIVIASLTR